MHRGHRGKLRIQLTTRHSCELCIGGVGLNLYIATLTGHRTIRSPVQKAVIGSTIRHTLVGGSRPATSRLPKVSCGQLLRQCDSSICELDRRAYFRVSDEGEKYIDTRLFRGHIYGKLEAVHGQLPILALSRENLYVSARVSFWSDR